MQYTEMTSDINLSTMTNSREILPPNREQLDLEIQDTKDQAGRNLKTRLQQIGSTQLDQTA